MKKEEYKSSEDNDLELLNKYRKDIDTINKNILDLISERENIIKKIDVLKRTQKDKNILKPFREKHIIEQAKEYCIKNNIVEKYIPYITEIFFNIIKFGRRTQGKINIHILNKDNTQFKIDLIKHFFGADTNIELISKDTLYQNNLNNNYFIFINKEDYMKYLSKIDIFEKNFDLFVYCEIKYINTYFLITKRKILINDIKEELFKSLLAISKSYVYNYNIYEILSDIFPKTAYNVYEFESVHIIDFISEINIKSYKIFIKNLNKLKIKYKILGYYPKNYYFC